MLAGYLLKYWNYPSEEFNSNPIGVIDVRKAVERASPADRTVCPRPRSVCLRIQNGEESVVSYFLTADSMEERQMWQDDINFVIGTLEAWNCLRPNEMVSSL